MQKKEHKRKEEQMELNVGPYECKQELGQGTYGLVHQAIHKQNNEVVAIKKIKFDKDDEGVPSTTLREISLLKTCTHPNIVSLKDIIYTMSERKLYLIFEFVEQDMRKFLDKLPKNVPLGSLKIYLYQLLKGLDYCHSFKIIHRDLKPQNVLVSKEGVVKIADFGLGRILSQPIKSYTRDIITLWYRAPEILFGSDIYSIPVDIWSVGCIFAEIILRKPLFTGDSQIDQLFRIFKILGTPDESTWPGVTKLPDFKASFPKWKAITMEKLFPDLCSDGIDLISKMLCLNPAARISARNALKHTYFKEFHDNEMIISD